MTRKKHLWIPLTLMLLASIAMINVPVKSETYETRISIRDSPIPGEPYGNDVWAIVDIESPIAWDNTANGIVGYVFSVHVDPAVLTVTGAFGTTFGNFLFDFIDWNGYIGHEPNLLVKEINTTAGDMIEIGEWIFGYGTLGKGAGGNSTTGWYGGTNGLCRMRFTSESQTAHTLIDIYDAYWARINTSAPLGYDKIPFEVVDDGHYNQVPAYLTVESTPFDGVDFTINPPYTTNTTVELQPGTYTVTMPSSLISDGTLYVFVEWEDNSTDPVRVISLVSNDAVTITATYEYGGPILEANLVGRSGWKEHAHFDRAKHGDEGVPDRKGTPGYQTLFAKIKNIGEGNVIVKAQFRVVKGDYDETFTSTENETEPGQIIVLTVNFAGMDGYPWESLDDGKYTVEVTCQYLTPTGWESGVKTKTTTFTVVPGR